MRICAAVILCWVFLGCGSRCVPEKGVQADPCNSAKEHVATPSEAARPLLTPAYRWDQVRTALGQGVPTAERDAWMHSPGYRRFPKQLLSLQLTDTGFVEYEPCNGINPSVEVRMDTLVLNWTLESEGYLIRDIQTRGADFDVHCGDGRGRKLVFRLEALRDPASSYRLAWQEGDLVHQWLVIPVDQRHHFDFVTNPCPEEMKREKSFREIDFGVLLPHATDK